jgi:hypothetical protein
MIMYGVVYYCTLSDEICVVRDFGLDSFNQGAVLYADSEDLMTGKKVKLTSLWIADKYWVKVGKL